MSKRKIEDDYKDILTKLNNKDNNEFKRKKIEKEKENIELIILLKTLPDDLKQCIINFMSDSIFNFCDICNEYVITRKYRDINKNVKPYIFRDKKTKKEILYKTDNNIDIEVFFNCCNTCLLKDLNLIFFDKKLLYNEYKFIWIKKKISSDKYSNYIKKYSNHKVKINKFLKEYNKEILEILLLKEKMKNIKENFQNKDIFIINFEKYIKYV